MKTKRKTKKSFLLLLASIILIGYFMISFVNLNLDIRRQRQTADTLSREYSSWIQDNSELERKLASGSEAEYIERIAREDLGYVKPGERVYIDISAGN